MSRFALYTRSLTSGARLAMERLLFAARFFRNADETFVGAVRAESRVSGSARLNALGIDCHLLAKVRGARWGNTLAEVIAA